MASTSLAFSSSSLLLYPLSSSLESFKRVSIKPSRCRVFAAAKREANDRDNDRNYGSLVDINMIVLRKRIHEMKIVERNYEPPSDWMEWEKQCFINYDCLICEIMGVLQTHLMNTRPSFALGIMALIALSVPFSTAIVFSHFVEMVSNIGINHLS